MGEVKVKRCAKCGSTNVEKGHQEIFPSTFMKDTRFSLIKALASSKEFEIYACTDCGYAEWYVKSEYLNGKGLSNKSNKK